MSITILYARLLLYCKWEFLQILHVCLFLFWNLRIVIAFLSNHFLRIYCPFWKNISSNTLCTCNLHGHIYLHKKLPLIVDNIILSVYTVLLRLKDTMSQGEFLMAIRSMPIAYSLFLQVSLQCSVWLFVFMCLSSLPNFQTTSNSACWSSTKRTSSSSHWKLTCSRHDIAEKLLNWR